MKQELTLIQIIDYYDLPVIFVAADKVSTKYLCLLVSAEGDLPKYVSTAVSNSRLANFLAGKIDLRYIFEFPEVRLWYTFDYSSPEISATLYEESNLPEDYLPETGYLYESDIEGDEIIREEAVITGKPIVHLSISDNQDRQSIPANDLSVILALYQRFIEYSLKKNFKTKARSSTFESDITLRAFDSSPGSFNIHLLSDVQPGLFGNSTLDFALDKFDEIANSFSYHALYTPQEVVPGQLNEPSNEDVLVSSLRHIKGHAITSYTKILKKIIDSDLKLSHKWYSPGLDRIHNSQIDKSKAITIYDFLTKTQELSTEIKSFEGYFSQVDIDKKTWRIVNSEDNKSYSGSATRDLLLGIVVEKQNYKIECEEILEENIIVQRDKRNYILLYIIPKED